LPPLKHYVRVTLHDLDPGNRVKDLVSRTLYKTCWHRYDEFNPGYMLVYQAFDPLPEELVGTVRAIGGVKDVEQYSK
jgi:hypothetical protein